MQYAEEKITVWLSEIFKIPKTAWNLYFHELNLYSKSYIFSQANDLKIPKKIFIKLLYSGDSKGDFEHYCNEKQYLEFANNIAIKKKVRCPFVYGYSDSLRSVAMEYVEGDSLFNKLWNKKVAAILGKRDKLLSDSIANIGAWLADFHKLFNIKKNDGGDIVNRIETDILNIGKRKNILIDFNSLLIKKELINEAFSAFKLLSSGILSQNNQLSFIHGDFTLSNMIATQRDIYIIDFSLAGNYLIEDDLARIILDLINVELFYFFRNREKHIFESQLVCQLLRAYGYDMKKNSDCLKFFLIKNIIINMTMYMRCFESFHYSNLLPFIFLANQKRCLINILKL